MNNPERKAFTSLEKATDNVHGSLAQDRPDWVDNNGECCSCVSMSHELADPTCIPQEILDDHQSTETRE